MASGTVLIAFCPSYDTIGVAAPLIVLAGRLLQGFSAGVEIGGVSIYLFEIATPQRRGFYTSFQSASQQVADPVRGPDRLWLERLPDQAADWRLRLADPVPDRPA